MRTLYQKSSERIHEFTLASDLPTLEEYNWCRATLRLIALGGLRSLRSLRPPEDISPENMLRPRARKPARPSPGRKALAVSDGRKERSPPEDISPENMLRPRARKPARPSPGRKALAVSDGRKERSEWSPSQYYGILCSKASTMPQTTSVDSTTRNSALNSHFICSDT